MIKLLELVKNIPGSLLDSIPIGIVLFDANGEIYFINRAFHGFEVLYPEAFSENLSGRNVFDDKLYINKSIITELLELKRGYPFESEMSEIRYGKSILKLVIKGAPIFEDSEFDGGVLIVEDLKITKKTAGDISLQNDIVEYALSSVYDLFIVIDQNHFIKRISGNVSSLFSTTEPLIGLPLTKYGGDQISSKLSFLIEQVFESRNNVADKIELTINTSSKTFDVLLIPQTDNKKNIIYIYIFFKDMTSVDSDLKVVQENLSNAKSISLLNQAAGQAIFSIDMNNNFITWDSKSEQLFEHSAAEVIGNFIGDYLDDLNEIFISEIRAELKLKKSIKKIIKYKGSSDKFIECYFTLSQNNASHLLLLCRDITDETISNNELNKTINYLSNLLTNADFLIGKIDENGNIIYANENFCRTFDISLEILKQKRLYDLVDPHYFEKNVFDIRAAEFNEPIKAYLPFKTQNGKLINLSVTIVREKQNGNGSYYDCYLRNIEEQKSKENEVKLFLSMLNASNDGIALGLDGKINFANQVFAEIFDFESGDELTGKDILDLVSNDDILKVAEYFRLLERKKGAPSRFDFLGKKKDASVFHAEISAGTFILEENHYIVLIIRDVSERIRSQRAIRASEEKYRNITENIDDFLFTFERMGQSLRPVFCTTSVQKITGYTQTDFLDDGKLFFKIIHPDDFQLFKPKLMNLLKSKIQNSSEFEFRIINKHGNIVWVRTKLNLVRIGAGRIQKVYGLVSDVTFRKRAEEELKKSTQNLIKLNETKDRFISIISHDLRTPFSSIIGFTDLLINDKDLSEDEKKQYVRYIQESSYSMLALVNSLLDWTRLQTGRIKFEPQKIDAVQIINDAVNNLSGVSIQKGIDIINLVKEVRLVFADKSLIHQVFINLISNAIKFTEHGGKIFISVTSSENPRFIEFSVKDTGVGIKPDNMDKLFSIESKFTSEGTAGEKGSGLGLSLVKEIVEKHSGKIWVKSTYGKGTDFRFTLPIASAKILIVDDNKTDRLLYSKILKNITPDYEIDVASNGKEALEKIRLTHPALVITDHAMPIMNGYEFVMELQKLEMKGKPPVIVLSSDIDRNAINDYNGIGIEFVFHKPVNLGHFKQAVEKSLRKSFASS